MVTIIQHTSTQGKLDQQPWNNLFSQKSDILSKRPIHKSRPFIRHKRPTFRSLLSSLINRTSGEREKNGKTGRKLWGQGEGYYRGRRRVVMWKIHRCVQRRLVEGWRAAHRTRESSCVSEGWLCHFYGTVHLHTVQQRREHASRCVIELKVAWLRAIFAARRLWNERNVESREFWNRIIYAFRLANWGG